MRPDLISLDEARQHFSYDPSSGKLFWTRASDPSRAGREAGSVGSRGYRHVLFRRRIYKAHRLIWLLVFGEWPNGQIDHVNRDRLDNRIVNLRVATPSLNSFNARPRTNKTGVRGVYSKRGKWFAKCSGQHLGTFETIAEADSAYRTRCRELFKEEYRG